MQTNYKELLNKMSLTCRSCLTKGNGISLPLLSVFPKFEKKSILDLLKFVTSSDIIYSESLPQNICESCFENLKIAYNFIVLFNNSQAVLRRAKKFSEQDSSINNLTVQDSTVVKQDQGIEQILNCDGKERIVVVNDDGGTYEDMVQQIFGVEDTKDNIEQPAKKIKNRVLDKNRGKIILVSVNDVLKQRLSPKTKSIGNDLPKTGLEEQDDLSVRNEYEVNKDEEEFFTEGNDVFLAEVDETSSLSDGEYNIFYETHSNEDSEEDPNIKQDIFKMEENQNRNFNNIQIVTIDDVINSTKKGRDGMKTVMSIEDVLNIKPRNKKYQAHGSLDIFKCHICDSTYDSRKKLMLHNIRNHNPNWKEKFKCDVCGIACKTLSAYRHHLEKHKGKRYACNQCDKTYTTSSKMKEHVLTVHEKKYDNKYLCTQCGKGFKFSNALQYHMNKHTNSRDFVCRYCGFACIALSALKRHERVHTGERPYACKHCKKTFAGAAEKQKHEFCHEGVFRHHCKYCNKKFIQTYNMKVHWMQHKGLYVCEICPRNFADAEILKFHYAHTHKIKDVVIEGEQEPNNKILIKDE